MFRKKKLSNYELERQVRIGKMRTALYDMLWKEIHKDDKRPMPMPQTDSDMRLIDELKEIVNG